MLDAKSIAKFLGRASKSGKGWTCLCLAHNDHQPSLSITDGEHGCVLVHCHAGCDQANVIAALKARGLWPDSITREQAKRERGPDPARIGWTPILPVPHGAPKPTFDHRVLGKPSLKWEYRDESNELLGYTLRFETPDDGKTFRPLTYCENQNGERSWRQLGFPKRLPLYGLNRLAAQPGAPVLIAEGEKAADSAGQLLMNMVAVSWPHGAKSVAEVDWAPLEGRQVYVWPDADDEGHRAGQEAARRCLEAGAASVNVIRPPADMPKGWDAADALSEDYPAEKVPLLVRQAKAVRGTTALIDGMRCVYTLWPTEEKLAKKVCGELGVKYKPNKVVRGAVVKANWPVELMGDGALVEFASVVDAIACAVALQRALASRNAETPADRRIELRIGVNLGDVIIEGNDIYGDGVNVAARLQELAAPGGIALSATAPSQATGLDVQSGISGDVRTNFADFLRSTTSHRAPARMCPPLPPRPSLTCPWNVSARS